MNPIVLKFHIRAIRNYIRTRLDWITIIEILLFGGFLVYYVLDSLHAQFANVLLKKGVGAAWNAFYRNQAIALLIFLPSGMAFARKQLASPGHQVLLTMPMTMYRACSTIVDQILFSWALLLPIWIGFLFSFIFQVHTETVEFITIIIYHTLVFFSPVLLGMFFWTAWKSTRLKHGLLRWFNTLVLISVLTAIVLLSAYNHKMHHWIVHTLITLVLLVLSRSLIIHQLVNLYTVIPDKLISQKWNIYQPFMFWVRVYMFFTPKGIRPFVRKDTLYILRRYKVYALLIPAFIIAIVAGIFHVKTFDEAMQWMLSISIASGYVFANMAFRFSDQGCELLSVVRSQPVSMKRYWFAKFWDALLPVIWITGVGSIALFLIPGFNLVIYLRILLAAAFINVTLVFVQTNFALYSYPYTRYASMWYNLYLVMGVLFFTILLFPPLSIAFWLFGYLAIFRVLKQLKQTDVLYD